LELREVLAKDGKVRQFLLDVIEKAGYFIILFF
jgi:hypothetical protein